MKRIVVVSDSHGNKQGIEKIFNTEKFDYFMFLGDCLGDLGLYSNLDNVLKVKGNCDFFSNEKTYGLLEVEGVKIFFTHGHEFSVKKNYSQVASAGKCLGANLVLCGHTHKFYNDIVNGVRVVNCPALSFARGGKNKFLVIEIKNKKISVFEKEN